MVQGAIMDDKTIKSPRDIAETKADLLKTLDYIEITATTAFNALTGEIEVARDQVRRL